VIGVEKPAGDRAGAQAFAVMVADLWAQEKCEFTVKESEGVEDWGGSDEVEIVRRGGHPQQISNSAGRWDENVARYLPLWLQYRPSSPLPFPPRQDCRLRPRCQLSCG
jgi:hypothetical protein